MKLFSKYGIIRLLIFLISAGAIIYLLPRDSYEKLSYQEGEVWRYDDLIAPTDITIYHDSATVAQKMDSINKEFSNYYSYNEQIFRTLDSTLTKSNASYGLQAELRSIFRDFYTLNTNNRNVIKGVVSDSVYQLITAKKLPYIKVNLQNTNSHELISTSEFTSPLLIIKRINDTFPDSTSQSVITQLNLPTLIIPNFTQDKEQIQKLLEREYATVTCGIGLISKGEIIIKNGEIVTAQKARILKDYEITLERERQKAQPPVMLILIGQILYVVILLASLYMYLSLFNRSMFDRLKTLLFIMTFIVGFFVVAYFASEFIFNGLYLVPFVIIPILIKVFFDARVALFCFIIELLLCAQFATHAFDFIFIELCGGLAAMFSLKELSRRSQLLQSALFVAIAYCLAYISYTLLIEGSLSAISIKLIGFFIANALMSSFAYILLFFVEKIFGYISNVTLVELSDINNPLLRKLSEECPGTFQHSMAVSNLASDAARRIGANELLIRAGALYHDIGKIDNPAFFTENQRGANPHNALDQLQSAQIIIGHITDGLRRADKAKLPAVIKDFITEHHGAGKAKYFYLTYCKEHPDDEVDPTPFTYPGPNPRSKETSILMMADTVEAASRSLPEHTQEAITELVNKLIDGQIADGLHNDSPISFKDIRVIKEAFIERLATMYHSRISYPDEKRPQND